MVIAGIPAHLGHVDPALELKRLLMMTSVFGTVIEPVLHDVFRPAADLDLVGARRQQDGLTALAIDLGMEEEIGREAAAGRGIDAPQAVAKNERRHRRTAVLVANVDNHCDRGFAVEQDVDVAAETQVLRSLTDVETDPGLALARIAAVDLHDAVLQAQPRKGCLERAVLVHDDVGPALNDVGRANRDFSARRGRSTGGRAGPRWGFRRPARR